MEGGRVIHWGEGCRDGMLLLWVRGPWAAPLGTGFCCGLMQGKTLLQGPLQHPGGCMEVVLLLLMAETSGTGELLGAAKTGQPGKPPLTVC